MSPALGTNGGRSKSTTVFMHFCIECNGKSLKFDILAKIKVTFVRARDFRVTKICYVYTYDLRKQEIKTGGHRSYKKMGAVPKVIIKRNFFARYDSVTNSGNASLNGLQKYDLKYGPSVHTKLRVVSKVSFTCKTPFFSKSQTLK